MPILVLSFRQLALIVVFCIFGLVCEDLYVELDNTSSPSVRLAVFTNRAVCGQNRIHGL